METKQVRLTTQQIDFIEKYGSDIRSGMDVVMYEMSKAESLIQQLGEVLTYQTNELDKRLKNIEAGVTECVRRAGVN